eukprot:scaffold4636_cov81-Isochrysis_galbana.AAC.3
MTPAARASAASRARVERSTTMPGAPACAGSSTRATDLTCVRPHAAGVTRQKCLHAEFAHLRRAPDGIATPEAWLPRPQRPHASCWETSLPARLAPPTGIIIVSFHPGEFLRLRRLSPSPCPCRLRRAQDKVGCSPSPAIRNLHHARHRSHRRRHPPPLLLRPRCQQPHEAIRPHPPPRARIQRRKHARSLALGGRVVAVQSSARGWVIAVRQSAGGWMRRAGSQDGDWGCGGRDSLARRRALTGLRACSGTRTRSRWTHRTRGGRRSIANSNGRSPAAVWPRSGGGRPLRSRRRSATLALPATLASPALALPAAHTHAAHTCAPVWSVDRARMDRGLARAVWRVGGGGARGSGASRRARLRPHGRFDLRLGWSKFRLQPEDTDQPPLGYVLQK